MRASEFVKTVKKALTPKKQPETGLPRDQVPDSRVIQTTAVGIQAISTAARTEKATANNAEILRTPVNAPGSEPNPSSPILDDPEAASDDKPEKLVQVESESRGQDLLGRLAIGDEKALQDCGIRTTGKYNTQVHEWALGRDKQARFWLVRGGPNEVKWSVLPDLTAIAHTHPLSRDLKKKAVADIAPTHPLSHDFDQKAVTDTLADMLGSELGAQLTSLGATLGVWLKEIDILPMQNMPGNMWYLFPSNADLVSSYTTFFEREEIVYTPFRLGGDGWPATSGGGDPLSVTFGPVRARLRANAANIIASGKDIDSTELASFDVVGAPLTFSGRISSGFMTASPGGSGASAGFQNAWYKKQPDDGVYCSRIELRRLIGQSQGKSEEEVRQLVAELRKS